MQLLEDLDTWTFETVSQVVREREYEPATFDYKAVLNVPRADTQKLEHLKSICRTACSMANSSGGFILFGVLDRETKVSNPLERIKGIPLGDHRKQFAEKVQHIQPEIHFETSPKALVLPDDSTRCLFVVHIPISQARPHMLTLDGEYAFYRRGDGGKADCMNFYEVRDQMLNTEERRRKIKVLQLYVWKYKQTNESLLKDQLLVLSTPTHYYVGNFMTVLADVFDLIPFDSGVVHALLDLPPAAEKLNRLLDQANNLPPLEDMHSEQAFRHYRYRDRLQAEIQDFGRKCFAVEQSLDALFGRLY
jgi:Putative DNA-binding domain